MLRNILLGAGVFSALFAILMFSGKISLGDEDAKAQGEVTMWGTIPEELMNPLIFKFNPKAKDYQVTYMQIPEESFNKELLEALASGTGPDIILAPHQYILSNAERIYPFPSEYLSEKVYKDTYVDGASIFLTPQGPLALPVSVDPIVLFFNRYLLSKHGVSYPPAYWNELVSLSPTLTVKDKEGRFVESAIASGASNVPHMKDIMMTAVGQLGQLPVFNQYGSDGVLVTTVTANQPTQFNKEVLPLASALLFFSGFADPRKDETYTWSQHGPRADEQFVAEKLAMYMGYASELSTLRSRNPKAEFEMSYMPQAKDYNTFLTGGKFYGVAAIRNTKNLVTALTVVRDFGSLGVAPAIANTLNATPPFRSYASMQGMPDVIAKSMLVARAWYDKFPAESSGFTATMMSDVLSGRVSPHEAAMSFVSRLQDLYNPY